MIKRIKFLGIPVENQERALDFYTNKIGFSLLTDQEFDEKQRWLELKIPGTDTGVALFTPNGHESRVGSFLNTAFEVDNIARTYEELSQKGVEFLGPIEKQDWGSFAIMKDSEGNTICISQS